MSQRILSAALLCMFCSAAAWLPARTWQDASGKYSIKGDLIAFNADQVIIQRENGRLLAIATKDLSMADRDYLASKEGADTARSRADRLQTWRFKGGYRALGRIVDYGQSDLVIARRRGKVYVNERPLQNLSKVQQAVIRRVVANQSKLQIENNHDIEKWLESKEYQPQTIHTEGVVMELENGDEVGIPFALFSETDQELLKPGWQRWQQAQADQKARQQETFMLEAQARAYELQKQQAQAAQATQQIAMLQLGLLAAATGAIQLWEVELYPGPGSFSYPLFVIVPGPNSEAAMQMAMQRYPGYVAGSVRRVSAF